MRSRLTFTLSAWLLGAVAISVLAMGSFTSWHLSQGFTAYLQARDLERFDRFVALVAQRLPADARTPSGELVGTDMPALLREMAVGEGLAPLRGQVAHLAHPVQRRPDLEAPPAHPPGPGRLGPVTALAAGLHWHGPMGVSGPARPSRWTNPASSSVPSKWTGKRWRWHGSGHWRAARTPLKDSS